MAGPRTWLTFGTLGLAFAVVLSPALMQTDQLGCHTIGDVRLSLLEVEVDGENQIVFDPAQRNYEVLLAEEVESVVVRAATMDEEAALMYNLSGHCPPPAHGDFPVGGGEVELIEELPEGHSMLKVYAHAPEGKADFYAVHFTRPAQCP